MYQECASLRRFMASSMSTSAPPLLLSDPNERKMRLQGFAFRNSLHEMICVEFGLNSGADLALRLPWADFHGKNTMPAMTAAYGTDWAQYAWVTIPMDPSILSSDCIYHLAVGGEQPTEVCGRYDSSRDTISSPDELETKGSATSCDGQESTTPAIDSVVVRDNLERQREKQKFRIHEQQQPTSASGRNPQIPFNHALALWNYQARSTTEMSFRKGDLIKVEGQYDENWWKGSHGDEVGFFPANHVTGLDAIQFCEEEGAEGEDKDKDEWQDDDYFGSYATLTIHHQMLSDTARTLAYKRAINHLSSFVRGKIVLDVGCGSGILSIFCAKAGAKHVYSVIQPNINYVLRESRPLYFFC